VLRLCDEQVNFYPHFICSGIVDGKFSVYSEAEIDYTRPIGLGGNRKNEILSMARIAPLPIP
jgi:hypothetical protein